MGNCGVLAQLSRTWLLCYFGFVVLSKFASVPVPLSPRLQNNSCPLTWKQVWAPSSHTALQNSPGTVFQKLSQQTLSHISWTKSGLLWSSLNQFLVRWMSFCDWNGPVVIHPEMSLQFSSAQSCLTLYNPMACSTPGLPVHHQLPEFTQTQVHWVSDSIQLSHPLSSPSPPTFSLSQHQGIFKWVSQFFTSAGQSIGASALTSVLPMNTQDWFL